MKIAYLVNQYPKVSHSFIRREIAGLEAAGHTVFRFTIRRPREELVDEADLLEQDRTEVLLARGIVGVLSGLLGSLLTAPLEFFRAVRQTVELAGRDRDRWLYYWAYLGEACLLRRLLNDCGAEVLHAHFGTNPATVAMLCRILGGPPFSFTVHGPEEFEIHDRISLGDKIRAADAVVGVSEYGRRMLQQHGGPGCEEKVHVVHCGVDPGFLAAEPTPVPDVPELLCVGRLCAQKNQPLLLDALKRVLDNGTDARIVLAGDGEMRPGIERKIADLDLGEHVRITGWLSGDEVKQLLLQSRALVLSSTGEGLPVVIMEALALCRPVISPAVAGIPELVSEDCGWLTPQGDVEALAGAMTRALQTPPETLTAMGRAGRERVIEEHSWKTEAEKLAVVLTAIRSDRETR